MRKIFDFPDNATRTEEMLTPMLTIDEAMNWATAPVIR